VAHPQHALARVAAAVAAVVAVAAAVAAEVALVGEELVVGRVHVSLG